MASQEQMDIDATADEVEATNGVIPSVLALIDRILAGLAAAGSDRSKLNAVTADLRANRERLAAAVAANPEQPPPVA